MKRITYFAALLLAVIVVSACSNIAEEDRLVYTGAPKVARNVLIEDFTGQKCVNCPKATEEIHKMQEAYGEEHVIPVAIHSGAFGVAAPKGLMTDLGKEYWDHWFTSEGQPIGKINRGASTDDYANWAKIVVDELAKPSEVELVISTDYDATTRKVTIHSSLLGADKTAGKYQLWLTEDSIVAVQLMPDGSSNKQYVHNHVLREAINGSWGEPVTFTQNELKLTHSFTISDAYKPENCSVVAFVYDDNGVKQVVKMNVK